MENIAYFGLLDKEIIASAMSEYERQMERLGNRPRAAATAQVADRLYRWLDGEYDNSINP